jgi:M6 family metalloprotease-like protein
VIVKSTQVSYDFKSKNYKIMNKFYLSIVATLLTYSLLAAPFQKLPYTIKQPNGTLIECFMSGDEFFNWVHDNDGYPIIKGSDNYYYYAVLSGETFVASQFIVGEHLPNIVGIVKMQDINKSIFMNTGKNARKNLEIPEKPVLNPSRDQRNTLHTGTINNIVIYIRFAGESDIQTPRQVYDNRLNLPTGNSLKAYYREVSYDQLTINSTHYPPVSDPETQNFSYQDSHPRSYFEPYHATDNPGGYDGHSQRAQREQQLLVDAVNWINANHPIPSDLNIDADNDGYVDNVCFMINGDCGEWNDLLWAHRWALYLYTVYINGKRVYDFTFQPENQVSVRTLCHEMFHVLGAPDLYHYYNGTDLRPVGKWDIMQSGGGHMLTYMKWKYAQQNWITNIPEITVSGQYTLYPSTQQTNSCFRIASHLNNQFFMVEYRKYSGEFESQLPGQGLIVYRINTNFDGNADYDGEYIFDEVYVYRPGGTTTTNGIVDAAAYSANSGHTAINDNTDPSSFLTDGSAGGLNIYNVTGIGDSISFNVSFGTVPLFELVVDPKPTEGGNPTGAGTYESGTVVELQANPNQGWRFIAWTEKSNVFLSSNPSYSYTMGFKNDTINAIYAEDTHVDDIENQFVIYPNPANNSLYISTLTDIRQAVIYDISGVVLMNITSEEALRQIDISSLKSGVYLIEVYDSNKMKKTINKFIKL